MGKSKNFFWASFADLMTALFVISLTLFIVFYVVSEKRRSIVDEFYKRNGTLAEDLKKCENNLEDLEVELKDLKKKLATADYTIDTLSNRVGELSASKAQVQKIEEIEEAIRSLEETGYFRYDENLKRHELMIDVKFKSYSSNLNLVDNAKTVKEELSKAGLEIQSLIDSLQGVNSEVNYIVLIEGMAARGTQYNWIGKQKKSSIDYGYKLSYERALSIYNLWKDKNIKLDKKDNTQVLLIGSGFFGKGRYSGTDEPKNKRILIQIIPKIGRISEI